MLKEHLISATPNLKRNLQNPLKRADLMARTAKKTSVPLFLTKYLFGSRPKVVKI
jgi:hypothetical protein